MSRLHPGSYKTRTHITIEEGSVKRKVRLKDILFIKAEHVYIRIYLNNREKLLHRTGLNNFYQKLPENNFLKVHRSFIVNQDKVDQLNKDQLFIQGHEIPISRSCQKQLNRTLIAS